MYKKINTRIGGYFASRTIVFNHIFFGNDLENTWNDEHKNKCKNSRKG